MMYVKVIVVVNLMTRGTEFMKYSSEMLNYSHNCPSSEPINQLVCYADGFIV